MSPLEAFHHLLGHRMLNLDLLENTLLFLQVGVNCSRMVQNESNDPVDLGQRTDRWLSVENGLRRTPESKVVSHNVKADTRPSNVVAAVMELDIFIRRQHDSGVLSFYSALEASAGPRRIVRCVMSLRLALRHTPKPPEAQSR